MGTSIKKAAGVVAALDTTKFELFEAVAALTDDRADGRHAIQQRVREAFEKDELAVALETSAARRRVGRGPTPDDRSEAAATASASAASAAPGTPRGGAIKGERPRPGESERGAGRSSSNGCREAGPPAHDRLAHRGA